MLGLQAVDIHDGTAAAGNRGKIQIAGAGVVYDPAVPADLKTLADLRSQAIDPRSANGATAYTTALTATETPVFAQGVLANNALATHATAVLMQFLRECKGGTLNDGATGGGD